MPAVEPDWATHCAQVLQEMVTEHQQQRAKITDETVALFTTERPMADHINGLFSKLKVQQ